MAVGAQNLVEGTGGTSRVGPQGSASGWGAVERASSLGVLPVPTFVVERSGARNSGRDRSLPPTGAAGPELGVGRAGVELASMAAVVPSAGEA
jgi:hypothetical protein